MSRVATKPRKPLNDAQRDCLSKIRAALDVPVRAADTKNAPLTGAFPASGVRDVKDGAAKDGSKAKDDSLVKGGNGAPQTAQSPPDPNVAKFESEKLKVGSKGPAVEHLQKSLNANGASLEVDGKFGPATEKAVKDFQKKKALGVDGVVGPKTWAALSAGKPEPPKPPTPPDTKPRRAIVIVTDAATNDAVDKAAVKIADQSEKTGNTGQATFSLPPGKHPFGVSADGFEQAIGTFEVTDKEESQLRVELKGGERRSKTVLTVSPSGKSNKGDKIELTATVTAANGKPATSGTVQFEVLLNETTRQTLKKDVPVKDGKAVHTESKLPKGSHLLDATFKPDTTPFEISQSAPVRHDVLQDEKGEDKDVADRIIAKLNDRDSEGAAEELRNRKMDRLLNVLVLLKRASKLKDFIDNFDSSKRENDRVAVAVATIKHLFDRDWFKRLSKLKELDRKAVLDRTTTDAKRAFEIDEPFGPPVPDDNVDEPSVIAADLTILGKIEFHSKLFGRLGAREFALTLRPNGKLKGGEFDLTVIAEDIKSKNKFLGDFELEGKVSLNAEAELPQDDTKVVFEHIKGFAKGEIQLRFKNLLSLGLKNVILTLTVKVERSGEIIVEGGLRIPF